MNDDWRPDWRDESQYIDHGKDGTKWHWEFLRRDEKFLKALPEIQELCKREYKSCEEIAELGVAEKFKEYERQFGIKLALTMSLEPSNDSQKIRPYGSEATFLYEGYCRGRSPIEPEDSTEVAFKIDLTMPIDRQLEIVRAELVGIQKHVYEKYPVLKLARHEWGQFVKYLRILDAIYEGAPKAEQVRVLLDVESPVDDDYKALRRPTKHAISISKIGYRQLSAYDPTATRGYYRYVNGDNAKERKRIDKLR